MNSDDIAGDQSWAFLTLDMLERTPNGVTFPSTVTFFAMKSMLKEVTPACKQTNHGINIYIDGECVTSISGMSGSSQLDSKEDRK